MLRVRFISLGYTLGVVSRCVPIVMTHRIHIFPYHNLTDFAHHQFVSRIYITLDTGILVVIIILVIFIIAPFIILSGRIHHLH